MADNLPKPLGRGFKLGDDATDSGGNHDRGGARTGGFSASADDRYRDADFWEGTISRRIVAYLIDLVVLSVIWFALSVVGVLSLGLLSPLTALAWAVAPLAYHTFFVSQYGATVGQRSMKLAVRDPETGQKPSIVQAFLLTVLFYVSITVLAFVPLLYCLFDDRDRFLHDLFSRTRTVRADAVM